ncbi:MAG: GNAT family N-acetyltransferase [Actinomycetota bacterium]
MIETDRLLLRKPKLGDAKALQQAYGDPDVMEFIGQGETRELEETRESIKRSQARWKADGFGTLVIERKEDKRVLGRTGFLVWNSETWQTGTLAEFGDDIGVVELGWLLAKEHWGQGYATEAAAAARDHAFRELKLTRLISLIAKGNERSIKVAERIGERYVRDVGRDDWSVRLYAVNRT